ncbi:hypothetical protein [Litorimonas haliclonae]|uniref:hypothetical protein n=1 Tax=Litorimonas haliclonae TaxID=2081977 RepID=UPI0039EFA5C7
MSFNKITISADVISERSNITFRKDNLTGRLNIQNMPVDFADCTTKEAAEKAAKKEALKLLKEAIDSLKD